MFNQLASQASLDKTVAALQKNGFTVIVADTAESAQAAVAKLIPAGSEVMTMTSVTLDTTGISTLLNSKEYQPARNQFPTLSDRDKAKLGAAPEYVVGSVHAVTEDGQVLIASNTGSQLPAYAYGSDKVIWVVGTQKIVSNLDAGFKRINDYVLPLESDRANKAYHITTGSFVSKLLIVNREIKPDRITIVLVKQSLGF